MWKRWKQRPKRGDYRIIENPITKEVKVQYCGRGGWEDLWSDRGSGAANRAQIFLDNRLRDRAISAAWKNPIEHVVIRPGQK